MAEWKDDFYKVLQVHPSAEPEVIEGAFKKLAFKYHDTGAGDAARMAAINNAYEVLRDPVKRKAYDAWHQANFSGGSANARAGMGGGASPPPQPAVDPAQLRFEAVMPGEIQQSFFVVRNVGGTPSDHDIQFSVQASDTWIRVVRYDSLGFREPFPLRVEVEAVGEKWNTAYIGYIIVGLDNEKTRVDVELRTSAITARVVFLWLGQFTLWLGRWLKKLLLMPFLRGVKKIFSGLFRHKKKLIAVALVVLWFMADAGVLDSVFQSAAYQGARSFIVERYRSFAESFMPAFERDLELEMSGDDVRALQDRLRAEGVYDGPTTGYFGPETFEGVKKYQTKYGIEPTGFMGPQTRAALKGENPAPAQAPSSDALGSHTSVASEDIEGSWWGTWEMANDSGTFELQIESNPDGTFTGVGSDIAPSIEPFAITGSFFGTTISFHKYYSDRKVLYEGTVTGNTARGTWSYDSQGENGTWSMTR
ncbi:MAG: peptidoglycan-binding protein [Patescibacteria group bacterium]